MPYNPRAEREAAILAYTDEDRDAMDDTNPVTHAETGPNRFHLMSLFFSDTDGVQIQEDCDLNEITVTYFNDALVSEEITAGPMYDWAIEQYNGWI